MNMLIDVALAVILVYFAIRFYRVGIIRILLGAGCLLISLAAAVVLGRFVSRLILLNYVQRWIDGPFVFKFLKVTFLKMF